MWLTTNHRDGRALWPLSHPYPTVLKVPPVGSPDKDLAFTSDGRNLVAVSGREMRAWNLASGESRVLASELEGLRRLAIDPDGGFVVASSGNQVVVVAVS